MSYTSFKYSNLKTSSSELNKNGALQVTVDLQNTGKLTGDEVVQLYVKYLDSKVERPIKEIRGFKRITLKPGEKTPVTIPLEAASLAYWDTVTKKFVVEEGKIEVMIGSSSEDIKDRKLVRIIK